jgi:cystathionine gamma-lyase
MHDHRQLHMDTRVIHAGQRPEPVTGAVMPPIFTSSTYAQRSPGEHSGFEYSRSQNPTRYALERMVALLEGSELSETEDVTGGGFAFSSGLAAMATCLELVDSGGRVIAMDDLYGGSRRLLSRVRERSAGLDVRYVDLTDVGAFEAAIREEGGAAMVWVETPTNPTLKVIDLKAIAAAARRHAPGTILVCDNTFSSPINQRPLEHGFDIVHHSSTKYLGGHSDVVGGILVTNKPALAQRLRFLQNSIGSVPGPFDAYLTLRGIKTLGVRMARHNESAARIARFLEDHEGVERVIYPGLASHPQHERARKQAAAGGGFGGMVTFFIKGGLAEARRFLESVRIFTLAESLGGVESLIEHPAIMTHASVPPEARAALGISDTLIRVSVGIEDCDDLIADLDQALGAAVGAKRDPLIAQI